MPLIVTNPVWTATLALIVGLPVLVAADHTRPMAEISPRYLRFVGDIEIEVTDPVAAAAYTFDWADTPDGPELQPWGTLEEQMRQAAQQALMEGLMQIGPAAGFKVMAGGLQLRRSTKKPGLYDEVVIGELPARSDDGTIDLNA